MRYHMVLLLLVSAAYPLRVIVCQMAPSQVRDRAGGTGNQRKMEKFRYLIHCSANIDPYLFYLPKETRYTTWTAVRNDTPASFSRSYHRRILYTLYCIRFSIETQTFPTNSPF